jgi:hypothetical protein
MIRQLSTLVFKTFLLWLLLLAPLNAANDTNASLFTDPADGQFDVSGFLKTRYGFMPVPIVITGPTLGFGLGLNLMFLHDKFAGRMSKDGTRPLPPSISGVAAAATENGSKMGGAYHLGFYKDDTLRTTTFIGRPNIFMDFYPSIGGKEFKVRMNIEGWVLYQELKMRLGESRFFLGANYLYAGTTTSPKEKPPLIPEDLLRHTFELGALAAVAEYDSRDAIFTPSEGLYGKGVVQRYDKAFGGNYDFWSYRAKAFEFISLNDSLVLGLRAEGEHIDGDAPFFLYPSVLLRGIANGRYQGQSTAVAEAELRYELFNRWWAVGFMGSGKAFGNDPFAGSSGFAEARPRTAGGMGFRYEIARAFKILAGVDLARGPEETAVYITVGSAWNAFF